MKCRQCRLNNGLCHLCAYCIRAGLIDARTREPLDKNVRSFRQFVSEQAVSGSTLSNKTWYHGTVGSHVSHLKGDELKPPVFLTSSLKGAEFYATRGVGPGVIFQYRITVHRAFTVASYDDAVELKRILAPLPVELTNDKHGWLWNVPSVAQHSSYDGDNPFDVVYIPDAVHKLRAAGYDCFYQQHDPTDSDETAEAVALFDTANLKFINIVKRFS